MGTEKKLLQIFVRGFVANVRGIDIIVAMLCLSLVATLTLAGVAVPRSLLVGLLCASIFLSLFLRILLRMYAQALAGVMGVLQCSDAPQENRHLGTSIH